MSNLILRRVLRPVCSSSVSVVFNPRPMSDKKDGGAGAIRGAGGKFGERESAMENQYFHKEQEAQLKKLKEHLKDEINHHEAEIKRHQEAIERQKKMTDDLDK